MVNYQNSIIYKICCKDINIKDIYVGSTANALRVRKSVHKSSCNNENDKRYNLYVYKFIRENGGWDNWDVVLVENVKCENKQELHKRERFHIEELSAELNKVIPNRSQKEYYDKNRELLLEQKKEYYVNNKEEIAKKNKQYRQDNKEQIEEHKKQYYLNNKDKIEEHKKQKFDCVCGGKYTLTHKARHLKTNKHQTYLQNLHNNN